MARLKTKVRAMRNPIQQTLHVVYEVSYFLISLLSRTANAVFFKGSMHQTLSARTHIEARANPEWKKQEKLIDNLFWVLTFGKQKNHCEGAWASEVSRARKTLQRNGEIN